MRLTRLIIILTLSIFLSSLLLIFIANNSYAIIAGKRFNIEIAKTNEQKAIGLSKYKKISNNFAMVFPFDKEGYYKFWMKDMKFAIDIIYVDKNIITDIFKNVPYPKSNIDTLPIYKPRSLANTIIEVNSGISQKYNFKRGDKIKIVF